jgi:hypothetical protein
MFGDIRAARRPCAEVAERCIRNLVAGNQQAADEAPSSAAESIAE